MPCVIRYCSMLDPHNIHLDPLHGRYAVMFDIGGWPGPEMPPCADRIQDAHRFANTAEALRFWQTQSRVRPILPNNEKNRPLVAWAAEIIPAPEDA